jgi:hypothetical protein
VPSDEVRRNDHDFGVRSDEPAHLAFVRDTNHLTTVTHRALDIALEPSRGRDGEDLEVVMGELCAAARRDGARAEELIVLFKKVWSDRPELRGRTREESTRLFDQVVTMCIKEYYQQAR